MRIKKILVIGCWLLVIGILIYTRFVNLDWGLPYPMHPDERNMANALPQLNCREFQISNFRECFNPHFFAYGQFPLYLGRFIVFILKFFDGDLKTPVSFAEAVISLRIISAAASIINVFVLSKIIQFTIYNLQFTIKSKFSIFKFQILTILFLTFSPYFIQFAHFGTTESLLMLFYSLIIFCSLKILRQVQDDRHQSLNTTYLLLTTTSGLALATKVSAVIFLAVAITAIILNIKSSESKGKIKKILLTTFYFLLSTFLISIIFSPHNLINFNEFFGSMRYESDVALGRYIPFYTRQFVGSIPVIFQFTKVFPYVLGWPQFILAILGFFLLPWSTLPAKNVFFCIGHLRDCLSTKLLKLFRIGRYQKNIFKQAANENIKKDASEYIFDAKLIDFLRFAFLIYFIPNAFIFAKWTRFMAPIFPILSLFAILFIIYLLKSIQEKFSIFNLPNFAQTSLKLRPASKATLGEQFSVKSKFLIFKNLNIKNSLKILNFKLKIGVIILITITVMPSIAYLFIYQNPDIRFAASDWIYKNIPSGSYILSETANVVDIPVSPPNTYRLTPNNYNVVSFNFYDLDESPELQQQLQEYLQKADYIFVPSRRIWANHTCQSNFQFSINFQSIFDSKCSNLKQKYPLLNKYYDDLFSGRLGFTQVAEFSSFPSININLRPTPYALRTNFFPDESAEETWTVFDHPTVRIFKKNSNDKISNPKPQLPNNFQNYQTTTYHLTPNTYRLLISDTPQKQTQGLMNVRSKQDIGGADGMIFIFDRKERLTFWNKNTVSDLDVYWLNDDKVVGKSYLPSIEKTKNIIIVESPSEVNKVIEIIK